ELAADDLALRLRVAVPGERREEPLLLVADHELDARRRDEVALDLLDLARAHEAVVHVHARELVAHRAPPVRRRQLGDAPAAPGAATKSRSICSTSPARMRPWSTCTHVSWSPTARCTSAAATAESTPPDSAQMTRASPTWARIAATWSAMTLPGVQSGASPAPS